MRENLKVLPARRLGPRAVTPAKIMNCKITFRLLFFSLGDPLTSLLTLAKFVAAKEQENVHVVDR